MLILQITGIAPGEVVFGSIEHFRLYKVLLVTRGEQTISSCRKWKVQMRLGYPRFSRKADSTSRLPVQDHWPNRRSADMLDSGRPQFCADLNDWTFWTMFTCPVFPPVLFQWRLRASAASTAFLPLLAQTCKLLPSPNFSGDGQFSDLSI